MLNFFIQKINVKVNNETKEKYVLFNKMTLTQTCELAVERSTLNAGDLRDSVIEAAQLLAERLKIGQRLELEGLGAVCIGANPGYHRKYQSERHTSPRHAQQTLNLYS